MSHIFRYIFFVHRCLLCQVKKCWFFLLFPSSSSSSSCQCLK